jgi:hypothetical protein
MNPMRCLLFVLLAGTSFAQNPGPPTREVRLRLLAFDSLTSPEASYVFEPSATQPVPGIAAPIKAYLNHESVTLQLRGSELLFSNSSKFEDMKLADHELARATLPRSTDRFLLIFLPAANQKFRIFVLDDSIKEFPLGSYRVFNLSHRAVKLTLEDKPYEFKSGQSSLITDPPVQANNHSAMYAFAQTDGKWQRIGSGLWPHPGDKRSIQIFFDNPESQQTELRGFRDISPPVPSTPKTLSP